MLKTAAQEQLLPGDTLQAKWDFAQQAGYDAIELRGKGEFHFASRLDELRRARKDGVVMPTVCVDMSGNSFSGVAGQAGNGEEVRLRRLNGVMNVRQKKFQKS